MFALIFGTAVCVLALIFIICSIPLWYRSCRQADIYNMQNKTSYTCGDFFWAGDQINTQSQTIKLKSN